MKKKGVLIVCSGPSGVGKGTILKLFKDDPKLKIAYSVSMTTRHQREEEKDGVNYFFVSRERFQQAIDNGELLEYAEFVGNYYGTPKSYVEKLLAEGYNVLLEIEVQGALQVLKKCPDALSIFIVPPSMEELEKRIRGRNSETEEMIQERLLKAEKELPSSNHYQYVICNDKPEKARDEIVTIILNAMQEANNEV